MDEIDLRSITLAMTFTQKCGFNFKEVWGDGK